MQRGYLKFLALTGLLIMFFSVQAFSQTSSHRLRTADSLFQTKRYTQSFDHYDQMLKQNQFTPAMLLKMAFIKEGLLQIGESMYYLNLYFIATHDESALDKMNELASKYNLEGYEASETDKLLTNYYDNYNYISMAVVALLVLAFALTYFTRFRLKRKPIVSFALVAFFAATLFIHLFYGERIQTGIITNASTYLMAGPSSAANVVEIINDGHKVEVIGQKDVWLKIKWAGDVVYVKRNTVVPIRL
jgi:uncharacterized protein with PQ loop repeat